MVNLDLLCALCVFVASVAVKGNNRFYRKESHEDTNPENSPNFEGLANCKNL